MPGQGQYGGREDPRFEDRCAGYFPAAGPSLALKAWRAPSVTLAQFVSSGGLVHMSADSCCNSNAVS
jgi:hypothetical protein